MSPTLPYHCALAAAAVAAAWRVRPLRPAAALYVAMAALDAVPAGGAWQLVRVWRQVAWPGLLVAGAAWGLQWGAAGLLPPASNGVSAAPAPQPAGRQGQVTNRRESASELRAQGQATFAPRLWQALALGYLVAAVAVAILYRPGVGVPAALVARLVAVVVLVALLARRRPQTWAQLALVVPAVAMAVGVLAGVWPLVQAGGEAVRAGWRLAHVETAVAMVVEVVAIALAWRAATRAGAGS